MPDNVIVHRRNRGIAAVSIVAALFVGTLIGRFDAPATSSQVVRPATALSTIGASSLGDARRAEVFHAMNGLHHQQI